MPWPPTVDDLRQEVTTTRSDASLHRILQAAVNVVAGYQLSEPVATHHALQLAVIDAQFDAVRMETRGGAQKVKEHTRGRNALLIELSRLRRNRARGGDDGQPTAGAATVPDPAAAPAQATVRYLSFEEWSERTMDATKPVNRAGNVNQDRVEGLLDDATAWCASVVPGNLLRGGRYIPTADLPEPLLAVCRQVSRDLVTAWLSPRNSEKYVEMVAACETGAADRLRTVAQAVAGATAGDGSMNGDESMASSDSDSLRGLAI